MYKIVRARIRRGGGPSPEVGGVLSIEYSTPVSSDDLSDLLNPAKPIAAGGGSVAELVDGGLSALSDYEVVEAIAAQRARINAAEGVLVKLVKELYSRPSMAPQRARPGD